MIFNTGHSTKVTITIDGADYQFPMFLGDAFDEKVAAEKKAIMDGALSEFPPGDKEARARFRVMYRVVPMDALRVIEQLKTPPGCREVVRWSGEKAGVPADVLDRLVKDTPMQFLRDLTGVLLGTEVFEDAHRKASGDPDALKDGASPLTSGGGASEPPPLTSDAAPTTGNSTDSSSPTSTPDSAPAA